jgi:hypothetical protein
VFTTNKKEIKIIYIFLKHKKTLLKLQSNAQAIQRKGGTKHKHICEAGQGQKQPKKKTQTSPILKQRLPKKQTTREGKGSGSPTQQSP